MSTERRPWGEWLTLEPPPEYWITKITVNPGARLSLQKHTYRHEAWMLLSGEGEAFLRNWPITLRNGNHEQLKEGKTIFIGPETEHRLTNTGKEPLVILEVARCEGGELSENDIVRIEDDFPDER